MYFTASHAWVGRRALGQASRILRRKPGAAYESFIPALLSRPLWQEADMREALEALEILAGRGEELAALLDLGGPPSSYDLSMKRMALSSAVRAYLTAEQRDILGPLTELGTADAKELVGLFFQESHRLRSAYSQHVVDWPTACIEEEWHSYRAGSLQLIVQMRRVLAFKKNELFARAHHILQTGGVATRTAAAR
ncbi:hypothetical protein [Sphingomonas nostoxanthinifaciens]|uniref:hypothetical protein n=1 Tax=Sphingomonas nostoxanthinifaciens TaxID=2872652 RepID=UPI001CC1EBE0|nr:hypothetical protein [Sphingomonas nostoxanthinifaciens]UAK26378.1 hypothetical protein K8P63_09980 [Sphingomonas nostoxanthinifaciens]